MTWTCRKDRMYGHDYPGVCGNGMHGFVVDEMELGARVALVLDDPDQWWWELHRKDLEGLPNESWSWE